MVFWEKCQIRCVLKTGMLIRKAPALRDSDVTPKATYFNRRLCGYGEQVASLYSGMGLKVNF